MTVGNYQEKSKRRALVTGASGFIGTALLESLHSPGRYEICGLVGKKKGSASDTGAELKIFPVDICDYETLPDAESVKETDVLIHAAGLAHQFGKVRREDFHRVNVKGTENVCRLALEIGVKHFILISSVAVYGDHGNAEIDESFACRPADSYAESKLESEEKARGFCERHGISLTILRPATVIGEGDRGNTTRLINALDSGRFLWIGSGKNRKSLIYKGDVARAVLRVVEQGGNGGTEIYNLAGQSVSMREIVETIAGSLQKKTPRMEIPETLLTGFLRLNEFSGAPLKKLGRTLEKWLSDDLFLGHRFIERFNFAPATGVSEALRKQVDYYLEQKNRN